MGGLSSIHFFLDLWKFFNFAKPLKTVDTFTSGPSIDPCGTPHIIFTRSESLVLYDTYCTLVSW